jgi:hypothetical protein
VEELPPDRVETGFTGIALDLNVPQTLVREAGLPGFGPLAAEDVGVRLDLLFDVVLVDVYGPVVV